MLSRTVTVGAKYAAHIYIGYLVILCILLSSFLTIVILDGNYLAIAYVIVGYSTAGIAVSFYFLVRIQNVWEQVQADLRHMSKIVLNARYGKHPER